jgi:hypothetical protein
MRLTEKVCHEDLGSLHFRSEDKVTGSTYASTMFHEVFKLDSLDFQLGELRGVLRLVSRVSHSAKVQRKTPGGFSALPPHKMGTVFPGRQDLWRQIRSGVWLILMRLKA